MAEKFRVTEIVTKTKQTDNPVLLSFQNGVLSSNLQDVSFSRAEDPTNPNKDLAIVSTKTATYQGVINDSLNSKLVNNYLAIKNRITGKVRLVQVDEASLIHELYKESESKVFTALDATQANSMQVRNFGSKKANRALERKEKSKINISVVQKQLEQTVDESFVGDDQPDGEISEANINKIRPPFNKEAKILDNIYTLSEIIPTDLFDRLDEEANAILKTETNQIPIESEYLRNRIDLIKNSSSNPAAPANLTLLKVFIYMDALQNLLKTKNRNLKNCSLSNITEKVETDIRKRFTEPNMTTMTRTRFTTEKGICYFIVLALITSSNFRISVRQLTQELSMSKANVLKYALLVFAKLDKEDLSLRLPSKVKLGSLFMGRRKK